MVDGQPDTWLGSGIFGIGDIDGDGLSDAMAIGNGGGWILRGAAL